MALQLIIDLKKPPVSWKKFCEHMPPFSIALDGFVKAATKFDKKGPYINFNHHENVDRLSTRSTCSQVMIAVRQHLFALFKGEDGPQANVYVNDCDEDICLSWFLLKNHQRMINDLPAKMTRLVALEDLMDATAGAYPFPLGGTEIKELAWIFAPYRNFRVNGGLDRRNEAEYHQIINQVATRIEKYLQGGDEKEELDTRYKVIGGGNNWAMFEEVGSYAKTGAYNDNIRAYVSVRNLNNNHWVYTLGKMSPYINFDIPKMLRALNQAEGNKRDRWGGSNTISGSPRVHASKLPPETVQEIINRFVE